jgi:UDP-GlcNAc:undecaprenyl-phosphate GlcNAc-1-phosphate transferase
VIRVVVVAAVAMGVAGVLTPVAMALAVRTGVVAHPGPLKAHAAPVPYLGGVAVFVASMVGALVGRPTVIAPLAGAVVLGVLDDRFDLPAWLRLLGQGAIGVGVALVVTTRVPGFGGGVLVTVVTVLLMNGVNFLDGLDALASGVLAVASVGFALLLHHGARDLSVALAAALAGFLWYNRPPARVYLGDGGAYFLGAALAALLAWAWGKGVRSPVSVVSLMLVAVPVAEVAFAVVRRVRARQPVTHGDRRHPYDLAVARGWSPGVAVLCYVAGEAVLVAGALGASRAHSLTVPVAVTVAATISIVVLASVCGALSPDHSVSA